MKLKTKYINCYNIINIWYLKNSILICISTFNCILLIISDLNSDAHDKCSHLVANIE